jgi:hypothetical protein
MIALTKTYSPLEGQSYTITVTVPYIEANATLIVNEEVVETVMPTDLGNWTVPGKNAGNQTVQASISAEVDVTINGIVLILGFGILIICL